MSTFLPPEKPESRESAAAAPRGGSGIDALFCPAEPFPLRELAIAAQALAMLQIERIMRPDGESDDVRCNCCSAAWVDGGIPRPHLEFCTVGTALHLAELALKNQPSQQVPMVAAPRYSPVELLVWSKPDAPADQVLVPGDPALDHHARAELVEAESVFPSTEVGRRIVEVPAR